MAGGAHRCRALADSDACAEEGTTDLAPISPDSIDEAARAAGKASLTVLAVGTGGNSRRRDCHSADIPSPSLSKRLLRGRGDVGKMTVSPTARRERRERGLGPPDPAAARCPAEATRSGAQGQQGGWRKARRCGDQRRPSCARPSARRRRSLRRLSWRGGRPRIGRRDLRPRFAVGTGAS